MGYAARWRNREAINNCFVFFVAQHLRHKVNKYVSTTKSPSFEHLQWKPYSERKVRYSKVWEFMGKLVAPDISSDCYSPIDDLLYCKLCFEEQKSLKDKGHVSKIYVAKVTTASGNHIQHARVKHAKTFVSEPSPKLTSWFSKCTKEETSTSQYDINRDLALFLCRDMLPFDVVEKRGFREFWSKNFPLELPTSRTVACTALSDVYLVVKSKVISLLQSSISGTLMMDGWTDRHQCNQYFAIRYSFVDDWTFKVVTLTMQPVDSHTADSLKAFVKSVISEYLPHNRRMLLFNTTDGAANMKLLSRLLGHQRIDCTAHCLHLLLTVDSFNRVPELVVLAERCKEIVHSLHFKGHLIRSEQTIADDIDMLDRVALVMENLSADTDNPITVNDSDVDDEEDAAAAHSPERSSHKHHTLKTSMCTRWNSTLTMIESVLDLVKPANEALKKIGKSDLCLDDDDVEQLQQLREFLMKFKAMSDLVSECQPNLSLIPLLRTNAIQACEPKRDSTGCVTDSEAVRRLKTLVRQSVDKRIKIGPLVKLASCFDPGVRRAIVSNDECLEILRNAWNELKADKSPVRHLFCNTSSHSVPAAAAVSTADSSSTPSDTLVDGESAAKKMRRELIQVCVVCL